MLSIFSDFKSTVSMFSTEDFSNIGYTKDITHHRLFTQNGMRLCERLLLLVVSSDSFQAAEYDSDQLTLLLDFYDVLIQGNALGLCLLSQGFIPSYQDTGPSNKVSSLHRLVTELIGLVIAWEWRHQPEAFYTIDATRYSHIGCTSYNLARMSVGKKRKTMSPTVDSLSYDIKKSRDGACRQESVAVSTKRSQDQFQQDDESIEREAKKIKGTDKKDDSDTPSLDKVLPTPR